MFENIRAVAMDVDGVLTDNTFWWSTAGEESKRFCFADVTGIAMARAAGLKLALISGESSPAARTLVERFAAKVQITDIFVGCHDKPAAVREFAALHNLELKEVCFIGDDLLDAAAMKIVGVGVAPANAQTVARQAAHVIATRDGGTGVAREIIELILSHRHSDQATSQSR